MPKNKLTLNFKAFEEYASKLDELGGTKLLMQGVEAGLKASKQYVNQEIKKAMVKSNLPAQGQYSHGDTEKSIDNNFQVEWQGLTGWIEVGFDFSKSGLVSIVLMYGRKEINGTPRIEPVKGLKEAVYSTKTKNKIGKLQQEAIDKVIARYLNGS